MSLVTAARYRFETSLWLLSEITTCRCEVAGLNEGLRREITSLGPASPAATLGR